MIVSRVRKKSVFRLSHLRIIDVSPEAARLEALRRYNIVDTTPEKSFDEIVRLASIACETPAAGLSFITEDRCWLKSQIGLPVTEAPRNETFCEYAFRSSATLVVPDARLDDRFKSLPLVVSAGFNFYAGTSLQTAEGHALGTLFVLDRQTRELSARQLASLRALANHALTLLERRRALAGPPTTPRPAPLPNGGVLIVDDDADVLAFAKVAARRLGYEVLEARDGAEALERFNEHRAKIDLVLTDVNMPVMDGLELVRRLRQQPNPPGIVVMSGRFENYIRASLLADGVTHLLGKPFSFDELELTLLQAKTAAR